MESDAVKMAAWRVVLWCRRSVAGLNPLDPGMAELVESLSTELGECPDDVAIRSDSPRPSEHAEPLSLEAAAKKLCMWIRHTVPEWTSEVDEYLEATEAALVRVRAPTPEPVPTGAALELQGSALVLFARGKFVYRTYLQSAEHAEVFGPAFVKAVNAELAGVVSGEPEGEVPPIRFHREKAMGRQLTRCETLLTAARQEREKLEKALRKAREPLAVAASYEERPSFIGERLWLTDARNALAEIDAALRSPVAPVDSRPERYQTCPQCGAEGVTHRYVNGANDVRTCMVWDFPACHWTNDARVPPVAPETEKEPSAIFEEVCPVCGGNYLMCPRCNGRGLVSVGEGQ